MDLSTFETEPFLQDFLRGDSFSIYPLAGDASTRKYFRLVSDQRSWVLMQWDPFDPTNYPFLSVQELFLRHGVQVPEVLGFSAERGLVILEDLGDLTLERKFWESQNPEISYDFYKKSIDELIKIHFEASRDQTSPCTALTTQFDTEKFLWEMNYAHENLLVKTCGLQLSEAQRISLFDVYSDMCRRLDREPKWICHRDYHSRNLMIKLDQVRVIDFQDARLGPIQYDLVSLLRDSYVQIPETMESNLLDYYLSFAIPYLRDLRGKSENVSNLKDFLHIYELQTIQRAFKACGSFSSFFQQRGDRRYLKYIGSTLRRVLKSLAHFPEYHLMTEVLLDSGALDRPYEGL